MLPTTTNNLLLVPALLLLEPIKYINTESELCSTPHLDVINYPFDIFVKFARRIKLEPTKRSIMTVCGGTLLF